MSKEDGINEWLDRFNRTPEVRLPAIGAGWKETGNPYYAWLAIGWCTEYKWGLPDWVLDYLAGCAARMVSKEARQSSDFRKILPRVMGFPTKPGRGHHPLRQARTRQYKKAAAVFGKAIFNDAKPTAALRDAANALPRKLAEIDAKTLLSQIKKEFGLTNAPRTNAEWKRALRDFYMAEYFPLFQLYKRRAAFSDDEVKNKLCELYLKNNSGK